MPELVTMTPTGEGQDLPLMDYQPGRGRLTRAQHDYLLNNLRSTRVASRKQGGKELHYLESWDVRAHLIRIFGFTNFDAHIVEAQFVYQRDVQIGDPQKPGWEVAYKVVFHLAVRDPDGLPLCAFTEAAVGSASGSVGLGDLHDNALKTAASDALKRCAINLGTQFGLSLYDNGTFTDVVKNVLVRPYDGETDTSQEGAGADLRPDQAQALAHSLGAEQIAEEPGTAATDEGPQFERRVDTPEQAKAFADQAKSADTALDPELRHG